MCRATRCHTCSKVTWAGCGAHVDDVMRRVPADERCRCADDDRTTGLLAGLMSRLRA